MCFWYGLALCCEAKPASRPSLWCKQTLNVELFFFSSDFPIISLCQNPTHVFLTFLTFLFNLSNKIYLYPILFIKLLVKELYNY